MSANLTPIASMVARDLALGLDYDDISTHTGLSLENIAKIARGNLVKRRVRELGEEIDTQLVQEAAESPVRQYLAGKGLAAAQLLHSEMNNYNKEEEGATAATRLKAAEKVLELGGHSSPAQDAGSGAVIMISTEKVEIGKQIREKVIKDVPDFVDG